MKALLILSLLVSLSACQTYVRLPSTTGQHPDMGDEAWDGQVGLQLGSDVPVKVVDDYTTTPPTRDTIGVGEEDPIFAIAGVKAIAGSFLSLNMRVINRLEIYYANSFGLKYMIFGEPAAEGYKATVFAGRFLNGLGSSTETNGGSTISQSSRISGYEFGVSGGYRESESTLYYTTLASRGGQADINIDNNGTVNSYIDNYDQYMLAIGARLGSTWYFSAEMTANHVIWKGVNTDRTRQITDSGTVLGGNFGFGYAW